ncbi:hypothetical protein VTH82DRAFT_1168 [Thermothelomyces myriococcoides]
MSAAVDSVHHSLGRHSQLDGMAQHHGYHEPYAQGHGRYVAEQQQNFQQPPQARQFPRLPPMSTIIPPAPSDPSPVLSNGRDAPYYGGRPNYYSDYATPSPVGQTPPLLPIPNGDPHPMTKRAADLRRSPTLSSTASDRAAEDMMAHELRQRQLSSLHDPHGQSPTSRQHFYYPSPRSRGGSLQFDNSLPPISAGAPPYTSSSSTSSPSSVMKNGGQAVTVQAPRSPPATQPPASPRQEPKCMSISNLLSTTSDNSSSSSCAAPAVTSSSASNGHSSNSSASSANHPTLPPTAAGPRRPSSEYRITVRQQPLAARSCGFGERDRRVIDPPPIVQLTIHDPNLSEEERARRLRHQFSVVHCSIWDEKGIKDMSSMPEDFRQQRRLMGTLVASPFVGLDDRGEEGCFFCFPDLSCRTPGVFRLKFALVVLDPARMCSGDRSAIVATAMSEPFQVYNAKDFPGMQASTLLTKRLKEQGCLISIKKGNEKRDAGKNGGGGGGGGGGANGGKNGKGDDPDDDDDDDDDDDNNNNDQGNGADDSRSSPDGSSAGSEDGKRRKRIKR